MLTNGIEIPGYTIQKQIGQGGMATVYLAIQESFEREVAIKVMSKQLGKDSNFSERFLREAKIVSSLRHPNIVTVFDVGSINEQHYLSMEFIHGVDLKERLNSISFLHIIQVIKEMALAIDYAARKGYVHRDIKPENIMIGDEDGRAILMDFGIAKAFENNHSLTQTGASVGTPFYMSPEQAKGEKIDSRSDIYSLGVVFYQLISGHVPYTGDSAVTIGIKHISDPIPELPDEYQNLLQGIFNTLLAKKAEERYQTGKELYEILNDLDDSRLKHLAEIFDSNNKRDNKQQLQTKVHPVFTREDDVERKLNDTGTRIQSKPDEDLNLAVTTINTIDDNKLAEELPSITICDDDRVNNKLNNNTPPPRQFNKKYGIAAGLLISTAIAASFVILQPSEEEKLLSQINKSDFLTKTDKSQQQQIYQNILQLNKQNDIALTGLSTLKQSYLDEVASSIQTQQYQLAKQQISKAIAAFPELEQDSKINLHRRAIKMQEKISLTLTKIKELEKTTSSDFAHNQKILNHYENIRRIAPQLQEVKAGIKSLKERYLAYIKSDLDKKNYENASVLIDNSLKLFPRLEKSAKLKQYQNQIEQNKAVLADLNTAKSYFLEDKLKGNDQHNAYYYYNKILSSQPKQTAAIEGMKAIAQRYYELANATAKQNRPKQALAYIKRGLSINVGDQTELVRLQKNIEETQKQQQEQQLAQKQQQAQKEKEKKKQQEQALLTKIKELIKTSNQQIADGQLLQPANNNALSNINKLTELSPSHIQVSKLNKKLEVALVQQIKSLAKEQKLEDAQKQLSQANTVLPNSKLLVDVQTWLEQTITEQEAQFKIAKLLISGQTIDDISGPELKQFKAERTIFIGFQFANLQNQPTVMQAQLYDGAKTVKIATVPVILLKKDGEHYFKISRAVEGFPEGGYHLELLLNDEILINKTFSIIN